MVTRREALWTTAAAASGAALLTPNRAQADVSGDRAWEASYSGSKQPANLPPGQPGKNYQPVETPNGVALPWKVVDGVKVYHLVAARLAAARERAVYIKDVLLPSRERILNATQLQYNAMGVSVFQLLMAKRDQAETAKSYVEALRDYWTAYAEAEQLRSGRLPSSSGFEASSAELGERSQAPSAH